VSVRVLITGGAGYIGSVLSETLLNAGYRVLVLDNLSLGQPGPLHLCGNPRFEFVYGDVRDKHTLAAALADADVIVPAAGVIGAPACDRDPQLAQALNYEAIRSLMQLRSDQQLVIYPTTNSGYGISTADRPCTEEMELNPTSLYGRSKVQAENEIMSQANTIAFRLATAFGVSPRMRIDLLVNDFVYRAATDGYIVLFEEAFRRNFVHVRDIADAFAHGIAHADSMAGQVYNLGLDSAGLSKLQLAHRVKTFVPSLRILTSPTASDPDKRDYVVSSERLRKAGFEPRRSLDDGIAELLRAYRMLPAGSPWRNA
jgi:nucleoside-diphosphate-sugar epimerase